MMLPMLHGEETGEVLPTHRLQRLLLITALVIILVAAVFILYLPAYWAGSLIPQADAGEYAVAADNLAHLRSNHLTLLHHPYPSRYPFGFPLLLAPLYWLPHATLANGIYGVLIAALVAVCALSVLTRAVSGRFAGVIAALSFLLTPTVVIFSHYLLSEVASPALVALSGLFLYRATTSDVRQWRLWWLVLLGGVTGLAVLVHLTNLLLLPALALALFLNSRIRADGRRALLAVAAAPSLALLALALYDKLTFGGVTATGYRFWRPDWYRSLHTTFAFSYAVHRHLMVTNGPLTAFGNIGYYAHFFITLVPSRWLSLPLVIGLIALLLDRRPAVRTLMVFSLTFSLLTLALYSVYFFQGIRFLLPLVPFMACAIGRGSAIGHQWLIGRAASNRVLRLGGIVSGLAVSGLTVLGLVLGVRPALQESYLYQRFVRDNRVPFPAHVEAETMALYGTVAPPGSIVVTDLFVPVFEALPVGKRTMIVPVHWPGYESDVAPPKMLPNFTQREERAKVDAAIAAGTPVFTDAYTMRLEGGLNGYHLVLVARGVRDRAFVAVYRLERAQEASAP
ncbi:MAG: ArnT family glycosyltransferase [Thermomicrobiales bacterium]